MSLLKWMFVIMGLTVIVGSGIAVWYFGIGSFVYSRSAPMNVYDATNAINTPLDFSKPAGSSSIFFNQ